MKEDYQEYFRNKKITIMGLGLLGRGIGVAKFLAECGTDLLITDLKSSKELKSSLDKLKRFKNIKYVLGGHQLSDFKNCDLVIKAAGVPFDSPYLKEAKKNNIPVEMDASLFAKLSSSKIIGITGTRGKSTVTNLIHHVLKRAKQRIFLGGNIKGLATLPFLKKVKKGDLVVLELDSWQLQGFDDLKISPQIVVFTNFLPDHLNYYRNSMTRYFNDKAGIFKYQKEEDYLILSKQSQQEIKKRFRGKIKSRILSVDKNDLPKNLKTNLLGEHNLINLALANKALKVLGLKESEIREGIETYQGEPGRLEFIKEIKKVKYYNDTNGTTPDAVIAALNALSKNKNIILIAGGSDKGLDYQKMVNQVKQKTKALILIKGTATDKIIKLIPKEFTSWQIVLSMKEAVKKARLFSQKGDIILLSPGAASFGVFKNEYDRGEQFVKEISKI